MKKQTFSYFHGMDTQDSYKIILTFNITDSIIGVNKPINMKIDTGASDFVLNAKLLGLNMSEAEFIDTFDIEPVNRVGIDRKSKIKYYRYIVDELRLGNIVLRKFPVFITFEDRASAMLVGMSFLRLFNLSIYPMYKLISFEETEVLRDRLINNRTFEDIDRVSIETYIDFDVEKDSEAEYVRRLLTESDNR